MRYVDGNVFEGDFKKDNMNGKGVLSYANGDSYSGDYKDDKKHGVGIYKYKSGDTYEGHWVKMLLITIVVFEMIYSHLSISAER